MRLADGVLEELVAGVLANPGAWGRTVAGHPRSVNVEFVSANPTGPLHIGNARGAFVGDLLCRVLEAAGHEVTREYYFNDFGAQVRNLGGSVVAIRRGTEIPEDGYRGAYVHDLAREVPADIWAAAEAAGAAEGDRRGRGRGARRRAAGTSATRPGSSASGHRSVFGPASRPRWQPSAFASTRGRARARSIARAGSSRRSIASAPPATSTSRTAHCGSDPPTSATTRTASSASRVATTPTSAPTSVTSSRSSAAASTTSSTSGAPTTTERWPGCATPRRRWASTATRSR